MASTQRPIGRVAAGIGGPARGFCLPNLTFCMARKE